MREVMEGRRVKWKQWLGKGEGVLRVMHGEGCEVREREEREKRAVVRKGVERKGGW